LEPAVLAGAVRLNFAAAFSNSKPFVPSHRFEVFCGLPLRIMNISRRISAFSKKTGVDGCDFPSALQAGKAPKGV
jgi:hypothetical protein